MSTQHRRRITALLKLSGAGELDPAAVEQVRARERLERSRSRNQRLEFSATPFRFLTSRWLWSRYPGSGEGELTRRRASLVSGDACAHRPGGSTSAKSCTSAACSKIWGATNTSVLADVFEAYLGALYLATDVERVARFEEHPFRAR